MLVLVGSQKSIDYKRRQLVFFVVVFCFVSFSSVFAFIKSVALRSVVLRYACCTDSHTHLDNSCLWTVFLFLYFSLKISLFPSIMYHCCLFLCRVRGTFSLLMMCLKKKNQPCDYKLDFDISLLFEI